MFFFTFRFLTGLKKQYNVFFVQCARRQILLANQLTSAISYKADLRERFQSFQLTLIKEANKHISQNIKRLL